MTQGPLVKFLRHMGDAYDEETLIAHMPNFFLQTSGKLRDGRGLPAEGRVGGKQWEKPLHDLLREVCGKRARADFIQWRVTAVAREADFVEQTAVWMQMIGQLILPTLVTNRVIRYDVDTLEALFRALYSIMGTEHMKDLSHVGGMGHYGDDGNASQEG
eukprot:5652681-Amphidinium_carterae.1